MKEIIIMVFKKRLHALIITLSIIIPAVVILNPETPEASAVVTPACNNNNTASTAYPSTVSLWILTIGTATTAAKGNCQFGFSNSGSADKNKLALQRCGGKCAGNTDGGYGPIAKESIVTLQKYLNTALGGSENLLVDGLCRIITYNAMFFPPTILTGNRCFKDSVTAQ